MTPPVTDINKTLDERGGRYGRFIDHAAITQALKKAFDDHRLVLERPPLAADQQEAIEMIFHKLGRIANGDPNYADSWVDIAGYAKLVSDRLEGNAR